MQPIESNKSPAHTAEELLTTRVREFLSSLPKKDTPITYQALARNLQLTPPNTIQQLTMALERLIAEDSSAGHPLIAALVISKTRGGLPAKGFFECAQQHGRLHNDPIAFHATEFENATKFWCRRNAPVSD